LVPLVILLPKTPKPQEINLIIIHGNDSQDQIFKV